MAHFRVRHIPRQKEGSPHAFPKGRILYREDDYDCREMVLFTLRKNGYQVTCVETGTEALSLAKNERFDLPTEPTGKSLHCQDTNQY